MGLSGVLEHEQTGRLGERVEPADVACLAIEVNGEDRRGARADGRASGVGIDQAGPVDDLAQHRRRPHVRDRKRRGDERVCGYDDLVAGADPVGLEHQRQTGRP